MQHSRREKWRRGQEIEHAKTLHALADDVMGFVRRGDVADDIGDRADPVEIAGRRILHLGIPLQQNPDWPLFAQRLLRGGDRFGAVDGDRRHDAGKQHHVANRHDDQGITGNRRDVGLGRG